MASISQTCHCGLLLKKSTVVDCFGPGFTVTCDGCGESVGGSDDIYKCPMGDSATHPGGSEFCLKCAKAQKREGEIEVQSIMKIIEEVKEEISGSADSRPSAKSQQRRGKQSIRGRGRGGRGRGVHRGERGRGRGHDYGRGGGRRRERGRGHGYDYGRGGDRRFESDGRGRGFHGGFQHGRGGHGPHSGEVHVVHHWHGSPPTGHFPPGGGFHGPPPFQQPMQQFAPRGGGHRGEGHRGEGHRVGRGRGHRGEPYGCGPRGHPYDGHSHDGGHLREPGHGGYSRGRGERGHGRGRGRGKGRVHHATARPLPKKAPDSSSTLLCETCNAHVEKRQWSAHRLSQAHFDNMSETEKATPCDKTCHCCEAVASTTMGKWLLDLVFDSQKKEAVTCKTLGEWTLHCLSDSHKKEAAAKTERDATLRVSDASLLSGDLDSSIDSTAVFRNCRICEVKCTSQKQWNEHICGKQHRKQKKVLKYCHSCKCVMKVTDWSRHWLSRAHYDAMDETTRNRVVDAHCRDCGVLFRTNGEWILHLMSESHKQMRRKGERTRVCHFCQRIVDSSSTWKMHLNSAKHKAMKRQFNYCGTCEERVEVALWRDHCETQAHYDKMPEAKRTKVVDRKCYYCRGVFCKTLGEWTLHSISTAHKSAEATARTRKMGRETKGYSGSSSTPYSAASFRKMSKPPSILIPTKFPHTCKLCEVFCSTPSKWRVHESSQKHFRSVELKRYCVACDRVLLRTEFEAHEFTQAHLEQMDDDSKNEVVNRWCIYCDDVLCRTQERWILHCVSLEHRCAEAVAKSEGLFERELTTESMSDETDATDTAHFVEFCNLSKDEMASEVLAKVLSLDEEYKEMSAEEITDRMHAVMGPTQLFEFVNADGTELRRKIAHVIASKKREDFAMQWQFRNDSDTYKDVPDTVSTWLCQLQVGEEFKYTHGHDYECVKRSVGDAVQRNLKYGTIRHLRLILVTKDKTAKQRIVWQSLASASAAATGRTETPPMEAQITMQKCAVGESLMDVTAKYMYKKNAIDSVTRTEVATGRSKFFSRTLSAVLHEPDSSQKDMDKIVAGVFEEDIVTIDSLISGESVQKTFLKEMRLYYTDHSSTVRIVDIQRQDGDENMARLSAFLAQSALYKKQRLVFHGTAKESVKKIAANGFNRDFTTVAAFGKGVYFGATSNIAHEYTTPDASGVRYMFACVIGITLKRVGKRTTLKPPIASDGVTHVDTLVDSLENTTQFVAMRDDRVVPLWLVTYKTPGDDYCRRTLGGRRQKYGGFG